MDVVQLHQFTMNPHTFRSETCYSAFMLALFLLRVSSKQSHFTLCMREQICIQKWKERYMLFYTPVRKYCRCFLHHVNQLLFILNHTLKIAVHTKKTLQDTFGDFSKDIHKISFSIPIILIKPRALVPDTQQTSRQNLLLCANLISESYSNRTPCVLVKIWS